MSTLSKGSQIKMKLIYFLPEGNYVREKDLQLSDIMRCGLPPNTEISVMMGNNIEVVCDFNFNNLVAQMAGTNFKTYTYQLLMQG